MREFRKILEQWRIQDFPDRGDPTPMWGDNLLISQILQQTAWKWRKLDREGSERPKFYYVDPPLFLRVL